MQHLVIAFFLFYYTLTEKTTALFGKKQGLYTTFGMQNMWNWNAPVLPDSC